MPGFRFILVLYFVVAASGIRAEEPGEMVSYWAVGSFAVETNAQAERTRIAGLLDVPVEVRFDRRLNVFRVLVPAKSIAIATLEQAGLAGWMLGLTAPVQDTTAIRPVTPSVETPGEVPPTIKPEPVQEPLYPEFRTGETLLEYCDRLPASSVCNAPVAKAKAKALNDALQALKVHCDAQPSEARSVCEQAFPEP